MAAPKIIIIKEELTELKKILKKVKPIFIPRVRMLIEIKKSDNQAISKRVLAEIIDVNHNSIQTWRKLYETGGIELLCSHKKSGFRPSVIKKEEHQKIEEKLNDPFNGLNGYKELLEWIEKEFNKNLKYNTLLKYCRRNFGSKVKVARKSHVKKDKNAVENFKKNL